MKAQLSNWLLAPSPVPVNNHCAPISALLHRFHFGQPLTEKPHMNKVDSFLVIIMILLSGFFVVYKTAEYQFSGVNFERQKNKQLVRRIQQLELEIKVAQIDRKNLIISGQSRQIASVAQPSKQNMIANRKLMDPSALAESYFKKAKQNCEKIAKEDLCTANIEAVVSQFPETRWSMSVRLSR